MLYCFRRFAVASFSSLLGSCDVGAELLVVCLSLTATPIISLRRRVCFCSGVSCHESEGALLVVVEGFLAPLPVLNLRALSCEGSMRAVKSPEAGAIVIQSSRFMAGAAADERGFEAVDDFCASFEVGRAGPKSSSLLLESVESSFEGVGGMFGRSSSGAGGRVGPATRARFGGVSERCSDASSSGGSGVRLRFSAR